MSYLVDYVIILSKKEGQVIVLNLRIISGKYKGKKIKTCGLSTTRETTDRTKETIFNLIGQYFDGGIALDLFAGSGSLGLEAISRGIRVCIFGDNNPKAIKTIEENVLSLKLEKVEYKIIKNDYELVLKELIAYKINLDLVFLDPPYYDIDLNKLLSIIDNYPYFNKKAMIIVEHAKEYLLPDMPNFSIFKSRAIGRRTITILERN